ncbi:hypothetical protein [Streptomyces sp. SID14515]|uniref:hypothetical protein n=1 Tax=Streptomyces sp. SID14515 TaxID=2706074 RepID=UPI0013CB2BE9|nr:hypothetical protein [Streptomyces sp. SID14515]NEB36560.1 hypothetical protein [Streptomyces sp. SID14515]
MNQCTAVALLPPPDHILALSVPGHRPEVGHVLCELGEDHGAEHAAMLWDEGGRPGRAIWARWNAERARLTPLPWCAALDTRNEDDACGLFGGHPAGHSWEVIDPTDEAITRILAERHPHLFPEHGEGGGS